MVEDSNIDSVTALGDAGTKKDDIVKATEGGTAVHEKKAIVESDIGANIGGAVDAAMTGDGPQLPSSPDRVLFGAASLIDADYTALGPKQVKLVKLLEDRGAIEGLIDNSTGVDVKVLELAGVSHDERDKIIDFLLTDCEQGKFRRKTLQEYDEKEGVIHRLVYWQHYGSGNKFVEFLLDVKILTSVAVASSERSSSSRGANSIMFVDLSGDTTLTSRRNSTNLFSLL